jgi:hypothetical protein
MKILSILFLTGASCLLGACTTIGQQITNQNGTLGINQAPMPGSVKISKPVNQPVVITSKPTIKPTLPPVTRTIPSKPAPEVTVETTYESRRVVGSYIVIQ